MTPLNLLKANHLPSSVTTVPPIQIPAIMVVGDLVGSKLVFHYLFIMTLELLKYLKIKNICLKACYDYPYDYRMLNLLLIVLGAIFGFENTENEDDGEECNALEKLFGKACSPADMRDNADTSFQPLF